MAEDKREKGEEERGFTVSDRRRSGRPKAEEPPKAPPPPRAEAPPEAEPPPGEPPPADFQYLVIFLATQALLCLGEQPDPMTGKKERNIPGAKHTIDLLSVIHEKTKGNLTEDEGLLIDNILYDLRMRYVQAASSAKT